MTRRPMRKLSVTSISLRRLQWQRTSISPLSSNLPAIDDHRPFPLLYQQSPPRRNFAQVRPEPLGELWFTSSAPTRSPTDDILQPPPSSSTGPSSDHRPPSERTLKLGRTLRTLSPLLPSILSTPLPQSILSPNVTLHLFPSTHPHLPNVKGRVPYRAALWTAPVAWGCVPLVGNTKLQILSEKIVRTGYTTAPPSPNSTNEPDEEKLVVRWKTEKRKNGNHNAHLSQTHAASATTMSSSPSSSSTATNSSLSTLLGGDRPLFNPSSSSSSEFSGLFIFSFDDHGRIVSHTIEHADESNGFDKTSKVVTLTDWLLGKVGGKGAREEDGGLVPGLAAVGTRAGGGDLKFLRHELEKRDRQ